MKKMRLIALATLVAAFAAQTVYADSTASAGTSVSGSSPTLLENVLKKVKASYLLELTGPTTNALSGSKLDGKGANIKIVHYASAGYRVGSKWSVSVTQPFTQLIDEVDNQVKDPFYGNDPYLTVTNSRVLGSNFLNFNLYAFARYYAPISKGTVNARNKSDPAETGNGRMRILIDPSISMGDFSVDFGQNLYFLFAKRSDADRTAANGNPHRIDMRYLPTITPAYQLTKNIQPYLEMGTLINHSTNGHWSRFNDKDDGAYLSPGANINVGKKLLLIPAIAFGPTYRGFKNASISLQALYTFL